MSTFTLRVDPAKVDREFKTVERSRDRMNAFNPMVTKLEDLGLSDHARASQAPHIEIKDTGVVMFTHLTEYLEQKAMPYHTSICCFHCTEPFANPPLGIPIEYIPSYYTSTFRSEKDDSTLTMRNSILFEGEYARLAAGTEVHKRDYFEVDGNFCSFPCMIAHYKQNQSRMEYKNAKGLMERLHKRLYAKPLVWRCAPDIRLLKKFGGHLSIDEFRSAEGSLYTVNVGLNRIRFADGEDMPAMVPVTKLYTYHGQKY
jgi:hypothetical protein